MLDGIAWVLRTVSPWRSLPERRGSWKTISGRFHRWQKTGGRDRDPFEPRRQADAEGRLDRSPHSVDGTVVRSYQHAAGAKGGIRRPSTSGAAAAAPRRGSTSGASEAAS